MNVWFNVNHRTTNSLIGEAIGHGSIEGEKCNARTSNAMNTDRLGLTMMLNHYLEYTVSMPQSKFPVLKAQTNGKIVLKIHARSGCAVISVSTMVIPNIISICPSVHA